MDISIFKNLTEKCRKIHTHTHIHRATSKRILKNNCEDLYIVRVNSIKKNQQVNVSLKVVNMYLYYLYIY